MKKTIGFIGCGNMGSAMARGIAEKKVIAPQDILLYDPDELALESLAEQIQATPEASAVDVAEKSDFLVLAVKPAVYPSVLEEIAGKTKEGQLVIVIAVGISFEEVEKYLGEVKIARVQPSTPALVGESDTTFCVNDKVNKEEVKELTELLASFGTVEELPEKLMDVVPSIASSAPAYALMLISAMADGGCYEGFPRDQAIRLSAQAVLGAAKLVLETDAHPDKLKDQICTPGGTTIEAVCVLENEGFRGSVIDAVIACAEKSKELMDK